MRIEIVRRVRINGGKTFEEPIDSFVKNFMLLLRSIFLQSGQTAKDVEGVERGIGAGYGVWSHYGGSGYAGFRLDAPEGNDSYGVVVGQSNYPVSPEDHNLHRKIHHGSEDGKLYYRACNVGGVTVVGNKVSMVISREFVNYGSTVVEVGEVGLVGLVSGTNNKFLIVRDTFDPRVQINPNEVATFEFEMYIEV